MSKHTIATAQNSLANSRGEKVLSAVNPTTPFTSMHAMQSKDQFGCIVYEKSDTSTAQRPFLTMPLLSCMSRDGTQTGYALSQNDHRSQDSCDRILPTGVNSTATNAINGADFKESMLPPTTGTALSTISEDTDSSTLAGNEHCLPDLITCHSYESASTALKRKRSPDDSGGLDMELCDDDLLRLAYAVDPAPQGDKTDMGKDLRERSINDDEWIMLDDVSGFESVDMAGEIFPVPTSAIEQAHVSAPNVLPEKALVVDHYGSRAVVPIARPPFPKLVRDRSPLLGVSPNNALRTCFRIGEALNVGCRAVRAKSPIVVELYAKVESSYRDMSSSLQYFVLSDLFHDRPPFIDAVYGLWQGSELWEYDSGRFLQPSSRKRLCRCVGRMKREGLKWKFVVLNIWEATWEDVEYTKDIVCS